MANGLIKWSPPGLRVFDLANEGEAILMKAVKIAVENDFDSNQFNGLLIALTLHSPRGIE